MSMTSDTWRECRKYVIRLCTSQLSACWKRTANVENPVVRAGQTIERGSNSGSSAQKAYVIAAAPQQPKPVAKYLYTFSKYRFRILNWDHFPPIFVLGLSSVMKPQGWLQANMLEEMLWAEAPQQWNTVHFQTAVCAFRLQTSTLVGVKKDPRITIDTCHR
ncbi:hypothetical protein EVAR_99486_1 [Eumeta japonica]|uniref:Uncharacterized protein n=1 Tax=Eumeta variegata TaxID=151549 RepID=A0A4C2ADC5_EUMVA|nr:hypothetical protein EVAR_99486_1 [Eumeta japonica]